MFARHTIWVMGGCPYPLTGYVLGDFPMSADGERTGRPNGSTPLGLLAAFTRWFGDA